MSKIVQRVLLLPFLPLELFELITLLIKNSSVIDNIVYLCLETALYVLVPRYVQIRQND